MPADSPKGGLPKIARVGLAVVGTALFCRLLALPLAVGCLLSLAGAARSFDPAEPSRTGAAAAKAPPARQPRERRLGRQLPGERPAVVDADHGPGTRH